MGKAKGVRRIPDGGGGGVSLLALERRKGGSHRIYQGPS